jgi:hypothetical protein
MEFGSIFVDLWTQINRHLVSQTISSRQYYLASDTFEKHVAFCLRLSLTPIDNPLPGVPSGPIPQSLDSPIERTDKLLFEHAPWSASSSSGVKCGEVKSRHGNQHQGLISFCVPVAGA